MATESEQASGQAYSEPINGSENDYQLTYHPEDDASILLTDILQAVRGNRSASREIKDVGTHSAKLQKVGQVIDDVLDVLEKFGHKLLKKLKSQTERVAVVKGIGKLIELANQFGAYQYLDALLTLIDVEEDAYSAERNHITQLLADVESQIEAFKYHIEEAGKIVKAMAEQSGVLEISLRQLDDVTRQASLKIKFGGEMLHEAEKVIKVLVRKANTAKWMSRAIKSTCAVICCGFCYKLYRENQIHLSVAVGGGVASALVLLSIFPENTMKLLNSVKVLQFKHHRLYLKLQQQQTEIDSI